ncbi:MAG: glycosyltransferase family 39 protein [Nostoc sp. ChiSLP02]|nr:glycosyltransferase family 39 protein [Nostoc sp. DedSLP05]MDZ8097882.1 glycosyltransferase family 39 protein [Nostoc sp. DedSLP01]MDZ8183968.1 glycosyltransferase family 39 protein [Nostoc sp. ChiSLP02]
MIKTINQRWSKYHISILIVIAIAIFLRFFMLSNQSYWYDEGLSLVNSDVSTLQESIAKVRNITNSDRFQPFYFIVLFWWRQLFGESEFAVRSFSALLGIASIILIFFTALPIYGKKHAFWSLLLVTFSSFCVYYSQEARIYALAMFIASLQLYFFRKVLINNGYHQGISKWLFAIFVGLGIFTNINICAFTAALCLSHIAIYRNFKQWLQWWIPAALLSLPSIIYHLTLRGATDPDTIAVSRSGFPIIQNILFVIHGLLVGTTYGPSMELLRDENRVQVILNHWPYILLLLIVTSVIFWALLRVLLKQKQHHNREQQSDRFFASVLVIAFLLGLVLAIATKFNWVPRHSYYLWLPLAMLIPSTFIHRYSFSSKTDGISQLAQIAAILLIVLNIYSLSNYYFNEDYRKDDYRSAVQYLIKNQSPSTQSVLFGSQRLVRYYGDTRTQEINALANKLKKSTLKGTLAKEVQKVTNNADVVLFAVNREHLFGKGLIEKQMSALYKVDEQVSFPYINIYRFSKKKNS